MLLCCGLLLGLGSACSSTVVIKRQPAAMPTVILEESSSSIGFQESKFSTPLVLPKINWNSLDPTGNPYRSVEEINHIACFHPESQHILEELGMGEKLTYLSSDMEGLGEKMDLTQLEESDFYEVDMVVAHISQRELLSVLDQWFIPVVYLPSVTSCDILYTNTEFLAHINQISADTLIFDHKLRIYQFSNALIGLRQREVYFHLGSDYTTTGSKTAISSMLSLVQGVNVFSEKEGFFLVSPEEVEKKNPQVIITTDDCSFDSEPWASLSAVEEGEVYQYQGPLEISYGSDFFHGLDELVYILHYEELYW